MILFMDALRSFFFFFFNDTATTEIYTLSLHDALPICRRSCSVSGRSRRTNPRRIFRRSEEHTSELQSHSDLVCRLLLEKKKSKNSIFEHSIIIASSSASNHAHAHRRSVHHHRRRPAAYFFFNDTATTEIYTLSLHDALPI